MNCSGQVDLKKGLWPPPLTVDESDHAYYQVELLVNEAEQKLLFGVRPTFIFTDFLKDETRPKEKVKSGSTRSVSGGPLIGTILVKKYFGAFMEFYQKNMIKNGSAVGINPYSTDWHDLAKELCINGQPEDLAFGAGDYSAFDASERMKIHNIILVIIEHFYPDSTADERKIRRGIWFEVTNSKHVCDGVLYEWSGSLPSGHGLTSIINTMYNNIVFRAVWHLLKIDGNFNKNVKLSAFGDDNLFSVSKAYRLLFNEMTICAPMAVLGLTYTTELKETAKVPLRSLYKCEFLKRGFRNAREEGVIVGPLRLDVCLNIPMWTKKGSQRDAIVTENCVNMMRELSLHSKEVFNYHMPLLSKLFMKKYAGLTPSLSLDTPYKVVQSEVLQTISYL
jgi:hypothetical protein